ncbi:Bgt-2904 [Blumeria graminis f. sp. tritici]|uniref:Bgt-2904 n=2 Tax=Blumeria graminis f. sp. tritici TaxID=62690 RepID=A0A381LE62_BLUGR|nr:Golgi matrix protein [Blumeria graminis f. sp. tritici 96224]VDB93224.1 Bgt-2904 [Blumeria graminis f. sp. tritici]
MSSVNLKSSPDVAQKAVSRKKGKKKKVTSTAGQVNLSTLADTQVDEQGACQNSQETKREELDQNDKEPHNHEPIECSIRKKRDSINDNDETETPDLSPKTGTAINSSLEDSDTNIRLEAMSQEREALLAEVEQLRKSLEVIQDKHNSEMSDLKLQHNTEVSAIKTKLAEEISSIEGRHSQEIEAIKTELKENEAAKQIAETQYQHLLGRVNTIKSSLGERLKADKQELAEAQFQIEELESQNETYDRRVKELEAELKRLESKFLDSENEILNFQTKHNNSMQDWSDEREGFLRQLQGLKKEAEAAKEGMRDWELLATEERSMRETLVDRIKDFEEQAIIQKQALDSALSEKNDQKRAMNNLQTNMDNIQESCRRELHETVESYEDQLQKLKKLVQSAEFRAKDSEASKAALQAEIDRLAPMENEIKEKNLLIGKLRHEAIILNDHLIKALKFLKKAKPEDNVDRQIVTNHFLHFLTLDRSDPKKFQILQLIASLLHWTDGQREQAGLARPGTSGSSLRSLNPTFHRTPSTPSLSSEFLGDSFTRKESLTELLQGFLERNNEENGTHSRSASLSSASTYKAKRKSEGGGEA